MNPWTDAPVRLQEPFRPVKLADLAVGETAPVDASSNHNDALAAYVRRWKDGSYHYDVARLRRGPGGAWDVMTVGGSSLDRSVVAANADPEGDPLQVIHHGLVMAENEELVIVELFLRVSGTIPRVLIETAIESFEQEVRPDRCFCAAVVHTDVSPYSCTVQGTDLKGRKHVRELPNIRSVREIVGSRNSD